MLDGLPEFLEVVLRIGSPLLFAAMGELILERSGLLNIGIEGVMLGGAFAGFAVAWSTGSPLLGALTGMLVGILLTSVLAAMVLQLKADQIVVGMALNLLALGCTGTALKALERAQSAQGASATMQAVTFQPMLPGLVDLPLLGVVLCKQTLLTWIALSLIPLIWWYLEKSERGLELRAVGENPGAAQVSGISVLRTRWKASLAAGALGGIGGAFLTISQSATFSPNCTAGRGFVALAAVVLGRYRPLPVAAATLFFGTAFALRDRLQAGGISLPVELLELLPYLLTLAALLFSLGNANRAPAALGKPY